MTGKETDFHVSDMKPFVFDSVVINPQDIARRDRMEFFIEKILNHRGTIQKRKDLNSSDGLDIETLMIRGSLIVPYITPYLFICTWEKKILSNWYLPDIAIKPTIT